jgi:hypothetical protein
MRGMRKIVSIAFCMLLLCSLLLIIYAVPANATSSSSYIFTEYYSGAPVTIDGTWTDPDEWHDVTTQYMPSSDSHTGLFEYKMDTSVYLMTWLLEFADNTNDAGDKWQICLDGGDDGGSAPNANDVKLEITGHTTLTTYVGSGTGWTESAWTDTYWKDSLTTSPHDPANHYVLEAGFSKAQWDWGGNPPPHGVRVAMYDASSDTWVSWPPTSTDTNPGSWGGIPDYMAAPAPEVLTIGVMLALSTVAVVVSLRYFRKPPKL